MTTKVARDAAERGQGICRTCLMPIWNEGGTIAGRERPTGWSDRIKRGGDSLVCFKAIEYRHVPLIDREAEIYDVALSRSATVSIPPQPEREQRPVIVEANFTLDAEGYKPVKTPVGPFESFEAAEVWLASLGPRWGESSVVRLTSPADAVPIEGGNRG